MKIQEGASEKARLELDGESAKERLEFLTLLLNAVRQSVIATDSDGKILYWNRFAEHLYGWEAGEVVGRNIADVLLPEDSRNSGRDAIAGLRRGEGGEGDWVLQRRNGSAILVHATSTSILDDAGKLVGIVGISWDISEQKRLQEELHQSELRLRLIAEQLPAMVWATDAELRIVWNGGAAFRTRGTDPSVLIGKTIAEVVRGSEGRPEATEAHARALRGETVAYEGGDNSLTTQAVVQPFRDPAGNIAGTVGVALDITERKRVESELGEQREQLQALSHRLLTAQEAERRALACELHDDFGQLLTAIRLNLAAVQRGTSGAASRHLTDGIALVDQAIDKVRGLALDLRPAMLDDLGLVAAIRWLLKRLAARAGFEARLAAEGLGERLPTTIETCSFRLVQEALTNVARHAEARSVDIELAAANGELHIVVRDDGRGFDVSAARRLAARGESLGLLSMQERVTLAGGRLEISSAIRKGTIVDVHLPLPGPDAA